MLTATTLIATPAGWQAAGSLNAGDLVLGPNGTPSRVLTAASPTLAQMYEVVFDDRTTARVDAGHHWPLWPTQTSKREKATTAWMAEHVFDPRGKQRQLRVRTANALELPDRELAVDTYTLGAWLGDGTRSRSSITKADPELFGEISRRGYAVGHDTSGRGDHCPTRTVYGLSTLLRPLGVLRNKHIPAAYLRGSRRQRLDLLRGLMDTDGSWNYARRTAVFTNTNYRLSSDVAELVATLGWKPRLWPVKRRGFGLVVDAQDVTFTPRGDNPFLLPRKADRVELHDFTQSKRRVIREIKPIGAREAVEFEVDGDGQILVGSALLPTYAS